MNFRRRLVLTAIAVLLCRGGQAHADLTAMSADSYTIYNNLPNLTLGETIQLSEAITITALGYLDLGTGTSHDVGIYDLSQNLLVSTTVDTASDTKIGFFRYHELSSPLTLAAGSYVLAGETGTDAYTYYSDGVFPSYVNNFSTGPDISVSDDRYVFSSTLAFPPVQTADPAFAYFTANFEYTLATPEPSTSTIVGITIACTAAYAWRRRKGGSRVSARPF